MKIQVYSILVFIFLSLLSCKNPKETVVAKENGPNWEYAQQFYEESMTKAVSLMDSLSKVAVDSKDAKVIFTKIRQEFKKAEPYASYLNPSVGHRANGPALPVFTEDSERVLFPIGLQKIEESIYEGEVSNDIFQEEVYLTKGLMVNLARNIKDRKITPERFFIATHQQLLRIISLSISGFDTPVSHLGFSEAIVSLEGLQEVYDHSIRYLLDAKNPELDQEFHDNIEKAVDFIGTNMDFDTFDRYTFIRDYMNPITRNWVEIRKQSGLWEGVNNKPFNFDAPTFFEVDAFNTTYFTSITNRKGNAAQLELGEKLFFDPNISEGGKISCATCHIPGKTYADAMVTNMDNGGNPLQRNTPTLINSALQKSFFWDGRAEDLLAQISSVFTNDKEFNTGVHRFSSEIMIDSSYTQLFDEAYGGISNRNLDIIKALSAYITTLNAFNSKFDRNIRAEEDTFTEEEKLGLNIFMGKGLCATCHFMPLTNGTVPPFFTETEKEVIGVPETAENLKLDDDLGFYWRWEQDIHKGMFKTPTVRNAELTAPYMHNGVYETLKQVMDFYNKGGGGGMGFDLEHQTLPFDELNLSDEEQKALIAFIKTLTDTEIAAAY
ncbi:cytochrome c peroxidase [Spongiimicrobium salis]|uniref:cytochrome c peroxidase n=1 Tax=Spongiimicrobium salis TaxID=1667022 RepID=UPI00374CE23B